MIQERVKVPQEVPTWLGYYDLYVTRILVEAEQGVAGGQELVELGRRESGEQFVPFGRIPAPCRGTVSRILVSEKEPVSVGQPLVVMRIEPTG